MVYYMPIMSHNRKYLHKSLFYVPLIKIMSQYPIKEKSPTCTRYYNRTSDMRDEPTRSLIKLGYRFKPMSTRTQESFFSICYQFSSHNQQKLSSNVILMIKTRSTKAFESPIIGKHHFTPVERSGI